MEYKIPPTIDDPAILDEIKKDLRDNNIIKIKLLINGITSSKPPRICRSN